MAALSAQAIASHLGRSDPRLEALIRAVGVRRPRRAPAGFPALVRAILFQQISGSAGAAILARVVAAGGGDQVPPAEWFVRTPSPVLRRAGVSPQKIRYLRGLAREVVAGRLDFASLARRGDEEIIEILRRVKGIGRWTAQMYLLFNLGRPDVLPTGDLGLRKAVQKLHGLRGLPAESTVARLGRGWAPYRSHATYYLWRSLEIEAASLGGGTAEHPLVVRATAASRRTATPRARSRRAPRAGRARGSRPRPR